MFAIPSAPIFRPLPQPRFAGAALLNKQEVRLLQELPRPIQPERLVIVTDPGFDVDDETALVIAGELQKLGFIQIEAVIANTIPSVKRALLAKGTLNELGLNQVSVAVGANLKPTPDWDPQEQRLAAPFLPDIKTVEPQAQRLLHRKLEQAADKSLTILVIAGMTDPAILLKQDEALFRQKVKQVVIMGGVAQKSEAQDTTVDDIQRDANGLMSANTVAMNNRNDQPSANFLYQRLQELNIPVKVVTRKAATSTPISPDFFKALAKSGHPVAKHLRKIEGDFLNKFYQAACNGEMGPERNQAWFLSSFCKPGTPTTLNASDDIRPWLKGRTLYDPITLLACVDSLAYLFNPITVPVQGTLHQVIGLSQQATGLANPQKLAQLLSALAKNALKPAK